MLADLQQELMTPDEAARWFRRSPSWLRQQKDLLRLGGPNGQPLFHVRVCRAWVLGRLCRLSRDALRRVQLQALAEACGLESVNDLVAGAGTSLHQHRSDAPQAEAPAPA